MKKFASCLTKDAILRIAEVLYTSIYDVCLNMLDMHLLLPIFCITIMIIGMNIGMIFLLIPILKCTLVTPESKFLGGLGYA